MYLQVSCRKFSAVFRRFVVFRFQEGNMYLELCWSIWSPEQWIQYAPDLSDKFLDLTTLFLVGPTDLNVSKYIFNSWFNKRKS